MARPTISTFMYALGAGNDAQGRMTIHSPLNFIEIPFMPSAFSFAIIFGLVGLSTGRPHKLKIVFKSPEGKILHSFEPEVQVSGEIPEGVPPETIGFIAHIQLQNTPLEKEGKYSTEIHVDGKKLNEYPVWVIQRRKVSNNGT